ncbi:hypothetical protein NONI108955_27395 [Nocardia ninae]
MIAARIHGFISALSLLPSQSPNGPAAAPPAAELTAVTATCSQLISLRLPCDTCHCWTPSSCSVPSTVSIATCRSMNFANFDATSLPTCRMIAATTRWPMIRTATLVMPIAAACTAGAVGGNSHAAASSAASRPSELQYISFAYSISVPTLCADSPIWSKSSASFCTD